MGIARFPDGKLLQIQDTDTTAAGFLEQKPLKTVWEINFLLCLDRDGSLYQKIQHSV